MSGVDELVAFLRAALDRDEQAIERMRRASMHGVESDAEEDYLMFAHRAPDEVEAKRRILELHAESDFPYDPENGPGDYSWTAQCQGCYEDEPCRTKRLLAQPYAGQDGWREEWRA